MATLTERIRPFRVWQNISLFQRDTFMPMLPITAFYAVVLALLLLFLASAVVKARRRHKAGLGHDHKAVLLAGRVHGNATEYVPILLILMALAELNGANYIMLHGLGGLIVIARLLHAWGLKEGRGAYHVGRFWGTALTWLAIIAACIFNLMFIWPFLLRP